MAFDASFVFLKEPAPGMPFVTNFSSSSHSFALAISKVSKVLKTLFSYKLDQMLLEIILLSPSSISVTILCSIFMTSAIAEASMFKLILPFNYSKKQGINGVIIRNAFTTSSSCSIIPLIIGNRVY